MILVTLMDLTSGDTVDVDLDLDDYKPNKKGDFLTQEEEGMEVLNKIAEALKDLHEKRG